MLTAQGHGDDEGGAGPETALGADRPAVQLDQFLDQGQSDAAAFVGAAAHILDAMEPLEKAGHFLGGDAHAGVADGQHGAGGIGAELDLDLALEGELEGIGDQVQNDLLPHVPVHVNRLRERGQSTVRFSPALSVAARKTLASSAVNAARSVGSNTACDPARLDAGEVQQRVHQAQEPQAVAVDHLQLAFGRRRKVGVAAGQQIFHRSEHEGQRRAKFVADVAEEGGLGPVDLGQRFGALALFLVSPRVPHGGRDLSGDEIEEDSEIGVQRPLRRGPGHQDAIGHRPPGLNQRQHQGGLDGVPPRTAWDRPEPGLYITDHLDLAALNRCADRPVVRRWHRDLAGGNGPPGSARAVPASRRVAPSGSSR